jgi:hypothetical protein
MRTEPSQYRVCINKSTINAYRSNISSVALRSLGSQAESGTPAAVPIRRPPCRVCGHELMSHAKQVPQGTGCDAGQANEYGGVPDIVIGHVVNLGSRCEQFGAIVEANPNHKRTRLSRAMGSSHAKSFPWTWGAGDPYAVLSSTPGNAKPIFRTLSKLIVLLGIVPLSAQTIAVPPPISVQS